MLFFFLLYVLFLYLIFHFSHPYSSSSLPFQSHSLLKNFSKRPWEYCHNEPLKRAFEEKEAEITNKNEKKNDTEKEHQNKNQIPYLSLLKNFSKRLWE